MYIYQLPTYNKHIDVLDYPPHIGLKCAYFYLHTAIRYVYLINHEFNNKIKQLEVM